MNHNVARALTASVLAGTAVFTLTGPALAAGPSQVDQQSIQTILDKHKKARDEVKVAHLTWDEGLASDAQAWADTLASRGGKLEHNVDQLNHSNEGENLASSTSQSASPASGVDLWYAEKPLLDAAPNKTAFNDSDQDWKKWGHYTQMVWSTTTKIGCGTATGSFGRVTSCRYRAKGNIDGQLAFPTNSTTPGTTPSGVNPAACAYNPGGRGGYGSDVDNLALDQRDWEIDLANAINAYRAQNGLPALQYSRTLARPAMWASLDAYNRGFYPSNGIDSRGMDIPGRVTYCSGYTGYLGEVSYYAKDVNAAKWQRALDFWKQNPQANRWLLDRKSTVFAVAMSYGGNDTDRVPAYYVVNFGDH